MSNIYLHFAGLCHHQKRERDRLEEMLLSMLFITKINNSYKYKAIWFTFIVIIGVIIIAFISRALLDLRTVNCHI